MNPYQSSPAPDLNYVSPSKTFKPITRLTAIVKWLLIITSVTSFLSISSDFFDLWMINQVEAGRIFTEEEQLSYGLAQLTFLCPMMIIDLLVIVLFLIWLNRVNKNMHALGTPHMDFTSGWAVGWWFIPIANLFKPYQVVRELWRAGDADIAPNLQWKHLTTPAFLPTWWTFWLIDNILSQISFRLSMRAGDDDIGLQKASAYVSCLSSLVAIASGLLAAKVVAEIGARTNRRALQAGVAT